jgi:hypothetical protein
VFRNDDTPSIRVSLTDHQAFVLRRAAAHRIAQLAEDLINRVEIDGYTMSGEQGAIRIALMDLLHANEELGG